MKALWLNWLVQCHAEKTTTFGLLIGWIFEESTCLKDEE